jgi:hypothetical protein
MVPRTFIWDTSLNTEDFIILKVAYPRQAVLWFKDWSQMVTSNGNTQYRMLIL